MEDLFMGEVNYGYAAPTESAGNLLELGFMHEISISDLPPEVMEIIFEQLDSIDRKRLERVCEGWQQLLQRVNKSRTRLNIELPSHSTNVVHFYDHWSAEVRYLGNPRLEILQSDSLHIPDGSTVRSHKMRILRGLHYAMRTLKKAGADISAMDIAFAGGSIDVQVLAECSWPAETRKIRITRSNITAARWFGLSALYLEELWLDRADRSGIMGKVAKLFLAEHGPLTAEESHFLRKFEKRITIDAEPDTSRISRLHERIPRLNCIAYVDGYNWTEALMTIADGGHVSKHTLVGRPRG